MSNKKEVIIFITLICLFSNINISSAIDNYDDVLLVTNNKSSISMQIGEYFAQQRGIIYWVNISMDLPPPPNDEVISYDEFTDYIRTPIETYITNNNLQDKINYIITTKGVPLRHDKNK